MSEYEGLAAALAKAQASFPTISRDKEVTVQTKNGGSYKFKYAPLDKILDKVRKPLSDNGLSIIQLLDEDVLVTSLLHSSGAMISGRTPIPAAEGIQAYGSAITYLRRYAIQALLGIAAEEDDDGNTHAGNQATFGERNIRADVAANQGTNGGLIGVAEKTDKMTGDYLVRQSPDWGAFLGFRLKGEGRTGYLVEAHGPLAEALALVEADVIGQRIQVWGQFEKRDLRGGGSYRAFVIERIHTPTIALPAEVSTDEPTNPDAAGGNVRESAPQTPADSADLEAFKRANPSLALIPDEAA